MSFLHRFVFLVGVVALAGCATTPWMQYSHQTEFATYQQFYWKPVKHKATLKNPILDSDILTQHVKSAVVETLIKHGYERVSSAEKADFVITYHTMTKKYVTRGRRFHFRVGIGYPFYFERLWSPFVSATYYPPWALDARTHREAYLIIDIIDADTGRLVWRGWAGARLQPANFSKRAVARTVQHILTRFPPQ